MNSEIFSLLSINRRPCLWLTLTLLTFSSDIYWCSLGKKCVLLSSVQEFIEIRSWALLIFFICLHNQLIQHILWLKRMDVWKRWFFKYTKNKRLLRWRSFMAKFELVNTGKRFFLKAHSKASRKSKVSSIKRYQEVSK